MGLALDPGSLTCSECGASIEDTGYLPATGTAENLDAQPAAAVCGGCGFNEIGMAGCAPELDEVVSEGSADALLLVRVTDDGLEVVSTKS